MKKALLLFTLVLVLASTSFSQKTAEERSWNKPVEPFRIYGNIYYVGASEITSYLITGSQGHILIDGGFAETAPQIERNIEKLGFKLTDVKLILNTQAHSDHAGGLAELKRATGAELRVAPGDFDLVSRGGHGDFAFGDSMLFPPVKPDGTLQDGSILTVAHRGSRLDEASVAAVRVHITPGHTHGCSTFYTAAVEQGVEHQVAILCSTTAPGYKLVNNAAYPNIVDDFRKSFRTLRTLHPDIFLASHGSFFRLSEKRAAMGPGKPNPFIVPGEWEKFLDQSERDFDQQLKKQQSQK